MPTFKRRPEYVDARQFLGGLENGCALAFWVNSNEGRAGWHPEREVGSRMLGERIVLDIENGQAYTLVWINNWIVRRSDGSWEALRPEDLNEEYEEV